MKVPKANPVITMANAMSARRPTITVMKIAAEKISQTTSWQA